MFIIWSNQPVLTRWVTPIHPPTLITNHNTSSYLLPHGWKGARSLTTYKGLGQNTIILKQP